MMNLESSTPRIAAIFDLDGTLCRGHVWRGLARTVKEHKFNRRHYYAFLAAHGARWIASKLGVMPKESFHYAGGRGAAMLLQDLSEETAESIFYEILYTELLPTLRDDVVKVLRWHQERGHLVVLVSGGFQGVLELAGKELGIAHIVGTQLEISDERLTGDLAGPYCFGESKAELLKEYLLSNGLAVDWSRSFAYADRIHDQYVMGLVGFPVAVYPDDDLLDMVEARGWHIIESEDDDDDLDGR